MILEADQPHFEAAVTALSNHVGKAHAITLCALAERIGVSRRRAEQLLQIYADDLPFVVCGGSSGMYLAASPEDLNHERNSRMSRIRNIAIGWRSRRRKAEALGWRQERGRFVSAPRQLSLALDERPSS